MEHVSEPAHFCGRDVDEGLALVLRLAQQVTSRHDLDDVLAETFRCLRPLASFGGGSIQLLDDDGYIQLVASDPAPAARALARRVPLGGSIAGRVILTEQPIYLPDLDAAGPSPRLTALGGARSYLGVPLLAEGRAVGLLQVDAAEPDAWTADERRLFVLAAPVVSAAIQNARAHARVALARARTRAVEHRLDEARLLVGSARACAAVGDTAELSRHLGRLQSLLGDSIEVASLRDALPVQRVAVRV